MGMHPNILLLLLLTTTMIPAIPASAALLTGNLHIWDEIFASRELTRTHTHSHHFIWTEGPAFDHEYTHLYWSDTIRDRLYAMPVRAWSMMFEEDEMEMEVRVVMEHSGDGRTDEDGWRAEPGSNGMAMMYPNHTYNTPNHTIRSSSRSDIASKEAVLCQHGARRLSRIDLNTGLVTPLATRYRGKRFNGPNDVAVRWEYDGSGMSRNVSRYYAYFTDPVYAWLEKDRFEDLPYLDERVREDGPGHCGVYRVEITEDNGITSEESVELIVSSMQRPNGIGFVGDDLIVSDCCQGSHLENCTSGTSRWEIFRQKMEEGSSSTWIHRATIEDHVSPDEAEGGCSDGFDLYEYYDGLSTDDIRKTSNLRSFLLASCFGGLCVVDLELKKVVVRMWTAKEKFGGCKISNVAVAKRHGMVILTGNCGISMIPLRNEMKVTSEDEVYSEL